MGGGTLALIEFLGGYAFAQLSRSGKKMFNVLEVFSTFAGYACLDDSVQFGVALGLPSPILFRFRSDTVLIP